MLLLLLLHGGCLVTDWRISDRAMEAAAAAALNKALSKQVPGLVAYALSVALMAQVVASVSRSVKALLLLQFEADNDTSIGLHCHGSRSSGLSPLTQHCQPLVMSSVAWMYGVTGQLHATTSALCTLTL
jgi:hypothetical protein